MSFPQGSGEGTINPRWLLAGNAGDMFAPADPSTDFGEGTAITSVDNTVPAAAESLQTEPLFSGYVCPLPKFDLHALADGLQERNRKIPAPAEDDPNLVRNQSDFFVRVLYGAMTSAPENPTEHQAEQWRIFQAEMRKIPDREVLLVQTAAEIVRSVLRLHEVEHEGETSFTQTRVGDDGQVTETRVEVLDAEELYIGDSLRPDQIEYLQIGDDDNRLSSSKRLNKICTVVQQAKLAVFATLTGVDEVEALVAGPNAAERKHARPRQ